MKNSKRHRVVESFGDFMGATKAIQKGNSVQPAQFGANPDADENQGKLPFEFERRPEIGEEATLSKLTLMLEKIQAIADAGVNKSKNVKGDVSPYIEREIELAYKHLREGYLRLMDMRSH
jgi:hypothetical protein